MKFGLLLDNVPIGQSVPQSSIDKLVAMRASAVGLLWTAGTRHGHEVYEQCEHWLSYPLFLLRIGGHRQTTDEWWDYARDATEQVPSRILQEGRIVLVAGNEPNLENWPDPITYGQFYASLHPDSQSLPIAFACPSLGITGWERYLETALAQLPRQPAHMIANLYAENIRHAPMLRTLCDHLYVGEVNRLQMPRVDWFRQEALPTLEATGVEAATVFIAGGQSNGQWNEDYILLLEEAAAITLEEPMADDPRIQQLLDQNGHITQALIAILKDNLWHGPESVAGQVVALTGQKLEELGITVPK